MNERMKKNIKEYYEQIIELTAQLLKNYGYQRSGGLGVFYKYNSDKTKGYLIGFRKSLDNTHDFCIFNILYGCISIDELRNFGIHSNKITLKDLKTMIMNGYSITNHSHKLDDFIISNETVNNYYRLNILPELEKILSIL